MKLVILDRDGVINEDSDAYIKSPEEWIPIPGSLEAISRLNKAGYTVAVATNQSGIARGYYDEKVLALMHDKMQRLLSKYNGKIDLILHCPHGPDDVCACRKPKPGMLLDIANHFGTSAQDALFIGDTLGDMQAAEQANMPFVLVKTGKGERTLKTARTNTNLAVYNSLADYVEQLICVR